MLLMSDYVLFYPLAMILDLYLNKNKTFAILKTHNEKKVHRKFYNHRQGSIGKRILTITKSLLKFLECIINIL